MKLYINKLISPVWIFLFHWALSFVCLYEFQEIACISRQLSIMGSIPMDLEVYVWHDQTFTWSPLIYFCTICKFCRMWSFIILYNSITILIFFLFLIRKSILTFAFLRHSLYGYVGSCRLITMYYCWLHSPVNCRRTSLSLR